MKHMIYHNPLTVALLLISIPTIGQTLTVSVNHTPQQLVEHFLIEPGVQVSNVQFTGNAQARGHFYGLASNSVMPSGVLLSSGLATDAEGPNGTPFSDVGTDFDGLGDPLLTAMSGSNQGTKDAAILEFDFQLASDTVYLRYVFASNEYMMYVGMGVNDVFALLLSGPGIDGERNIALIPGTETPVSVDNVNANVNAQYYVDNENPPGSAVEYNGFTYPFTAQAVIVPNQTYHMRIAIADAGDGLYDSAVFLLEHSFRGSLIGMRVKTDDAASSHTVHPNPLSETATLTYANPGQQTCTLTLTTLTGQQVRTLTDTTGQIRIDRGDLPSGIYLYQLHMADGQRVAGKVVVR